MVPAGQTAHGSASAQFLAVAGGLNTSVCRLDVHVGSGVLQHRRNPDDELNHLLRVHDICLLNTWGSARAGHCATFCNGSIRSQIDFVATRRTITDVHARTAKPLDIDLAPWRLGPKHKPVLGSIPWIGAWQLRRASRPTSSPYSLTALRACPRADPDKWSQFSLAVRQVVAAQVGVPTVAQLNQLVLPICRRYFPPRPAQYPFWNPLGLPFRKCGLLSGRGSVPPG